MRKLFALALALTTIAVLAACGGEEAPLIIYQNKVEIDDVLKEYAAAWGEANGVEVEVRTCGGDTCGYADNLVAEFNASQQPDIFVFEGLGQFLTYQSKIMPLDGEEWLDETGVEFMFEGETYGFPINLEGWGLGYNVEILEEAGVDPSTLTSLAAYEAAFETIEAQKADLGLDGVVSMAAGSGLTWVTGLHNFNGYLSSGLETSDRSVTEDLLNGIADMDRLEALADWVELLFDYSVPDVLLEGSYDQQVNAFKLGRAAFIHQGNWIDPNLNADGGLDFEVGYAPHASGLGTVDSIFVGAPSYYGINPDGDSTENAKKFLNDMVFTEEGQDYMLNKANFVPAFNTVTDSPTSPLSAQVYEYAQSGKISAWWQNDMPPGFGMEQLGPIYTLFADGTYTKEEFIEALADEIETLAD